MKKKTIGILGGMGPEATVDVFRWIVALTSRDKDTSLDEEHVPIIIHNNPQVPSRVKAILENGESPVPALVKMARDLEKMGADFLIMPCHSASYFIEEIREKISIPLLSIVEETVDYLEDCCPKVRRVGLLATEQVLRVGMYQKAFSSRAIEVIGEDVEVVDEASSLIKSGYRKWYGVELDGDRARLFASVKDKKGYFSVLLPDLKKLRLKVSRAIYGRLGIKSGHYSEPKKLLRSAAYDLKRRGAEVVVLGCTELPLALQQKDVKVKLINPTKVLAEEAVKISLGEREV